MLAVEATEALQRGRQAIENKLREEIAVLSGELERISPHSNGECDRWSLRMYGQLVERKRQLLESLASVH